MSQALAYIRTIDLRSPQGIYLRATTVKGRLPPGSRGSETDSRGLSGLWADLDIAGPGHKTDKILPPDEFRAIEIIRDTGFPEPTLWIHSGGGLYPWWLLDKAVDISTEEMLDRARALSRGWHRVIAFHASERGWHYGTEVADLARVLRIPGTVNRKVADQPRPCQLLGDRGCGTVYEFESLFSAMTEAVRAIPEPTTLIAPTTTTVELDPTRPGDAFETENWNSQDLLGGLGWKIHHTSGSTTYWTRAGKEPRDGYSATTGRSNDRDRLYVFSSSTLFDPEVPYTKFAAYALIHHNGNYSTAAKELRERYGPRVTEPPPRPMPVPGGGTGGQGQVASPETESDPDQYFAKSGLLVDQLAADVMGIGPLAQGIDDIMWSYRHGVWVPDRHVVRDRGARLLGHRYRRSHVTNAEDVIRSHAPIISSVPVSQFINFTNGLLDWRTGQLREHSEQVLSTVQMGVDYVAEATCSQFDKFLDQVVPADMVETVWELVAYLMYSGNPFHRAVMLVGSGRNGKGTLLRIINAILGVRNVTAVSLHDLVNTRFSTASLFGKIANIAGDIDGTYLESTAVFKNITGQDQVSAEHKGRDRFDFTPWAVPVFSANAIPASADATVGYLSRWLVVPFPNSFAGKEDRHLEQRLMTELPGIAANAVRYLPGLLDRGDFRATDSGNTAKENFDRAVDQVRTWVSDCTEKCTEKTDLDHFVRRTDLYQYYKNWCNRDGLKPLSAGKFYSRLESAGYHAHKRDGIRGHVGRKVIDTGTVWFPPPITAPGWQQE